MSKNAKSKSLEYLVSEYIKYNTDNPNKIKECEIRFGTKDLITISKYDFDNVISKLLNYGFTTGNNNGESLLRIALDKSDKSIENVRLELQGEHVIQDFCRNENLLNILEKQGEYVKITKKYYPKKEGLIYKPYDNHDFGFRLSFQLEEAIVEDNIEIRNRLFDNFGNLSKYYRYINRIEYVHPNFPFKCHLSMVRSSKKTSQNLKRSGVLDNSVKYEIEIEIDNEQLDMDENVIISKLKLLIKHILSGLQDTKYPISYREMNQVRRSYYDLFGIDNKTNDPKPIDFIGYSSVTLKLLNIQDKPFSNDINIRNNYTVTEKADGTRKLLYITNTGTIYMIDTQINIQYTGMHTKIKNIFNTILDGEHIRFDKKGKFINLFAAFDIYMLDKIDKRTEPFITYNDEGKKTGRLALLEKVILSIKMYPGNNIKENAFVLESKRFYSDESKDIFTNCSIILQKDNENMFRYNIDGLIFTPTKGPIPINNKRTTWEHSFKWKPPKFNTIDFLVRTEKQNGKEVEKHSLEKSNFKTLHLYCGFSGGYINPLNDLLEYNSKSYIANKNKLKDKDKYKPALFVPTNPYDETAYKCNIELSYDKNGKYQMLTEESELIYDNTIVEFAYDTQEKAPNFQWKPLRIRHDKTQQYQEGHNNFGNDYKTANNNWNTIHNPITQDMISSGLNIPEDVYDDVYYNRKTTMTSTRALRDFHNLVVKNLLIKTVSKADDTLMDFAVGKGGDINKWIQADLGFIYGVDIARDNIENKKDGACARFLNMALRNQKIPEMIFVTGDSRKNIRSGDGLEDDKYRMINDAVFGKGSRDQLKMGYNLFKNYGKGEKGFNVTSCQFALHYFFENKYSLENFITNVVECTKLGGYFIGTSYDGQVLFNMLSKFEKGESKVLRDENNKIMWEITKQYDRSNFDNDGSCIGYPIDVYQESINKTFTEYLVHYDYLDDLMNTYGFTLVPSEEIKSLGLLSSSGLFSELFKHIESVQYRNDDYKASKLGNTLNMTTNEKEVSFLNRYFIYKKIRNYNGDVNIFGASSEEGKLYDPESRSFISAPGTPPDANVPSQEGKSYDPETPPGTPPGSSPDDK
jgi:hypothetical protein